nr:MAG TPA: hypothetical protein [Caudoviricetes sp.]
MIFSDYTPTYNINIKRNIFFPIFFILNKKGKLP